jgi:hypothetical protein
MKPVSSFTQLISQQRRWIKGPFEQAWFYQIGIIITFGFSFFYQIAILAALYLAPAMALTALLSRFIAEFSVILTEKIILKQKRMLRYFPILYIYLFFIFIFLPISFLIKPSVSWRGDGYKVEYQ